MSISTSNPHQDNIPLDTRLLRISDVEAMTGLCRSAIYKQIQRGSFPKQLKVTNYASRWRGRDVLAWIDRREVAS